MDDLSAHYAGLVAGSYDCVDRIVVNAYYPLGHNPAGSGCGGGAGMTTATTPSTTLI